MMIGMLILITMLLIGLIVLVNFRATSYDEDRFLDALYEFEDALSELKYFLDNQRERS